MRVGRFHISSLPLSPYHSHWSSSCPPAAPGYLLDISEPTSPTPNFWYPSPHQNSPLPGFLISKNSASLHPPAQAKTWEAFSMFPLTSKLNPSQHLVDSQSALARLTGGSTCWGKNEQGVLSCHSSQHHPSPCRHGCERMSQRQLE